MITFKQVSTIDGKRLDWQIPSAKEMTFDSRHLTLLPALIDPHAHFRTPGLEYKEDWKTGAKAALQGGITTVFDMPNTLPITNTLERVLEKKQLIQKQLKQAKISLHFDLYLGVDKNHFSEIARCRNEVIGLKIFMGSSTGGLLLDDDVSLETAFKLAAENDLLVAVHAEDQDLILKRKARFSHHKGPKIHSKIRNEQVAYLATSKAIDLARKYHTRLYLLHISTSQEIELIRQAKEEGLCVYCEVTPHHLFLSTKAYDSLGTKAQVNPPLRQKVHSNALWQAIREKVVDTIGSDHAPHTLEEKSANYPKNLSGMPGIETTLPLLLDACNRGKIQLSDIEQLMHKKILEIFRLPSCQDIVLIDMQKTQMIDPSLLQTKCSWSPYAGFTLKGWPVMTVLGDNLYACH
ncbi:MAG TPA: dihydroorotase [Candidatus Rhabdochlamydia sp.]|jgi:dihydroorotase|nr:dihydroorotase [Candidatus Rhabdochlamydia sp.]